MSGGPRPGESTLETVLKYSLAAFLVFFGIMIVITALYAL